MQYGYLFVPGHKYQILLSTPVNHVYKLQICNTLEVTGSQRSGFGILRFNDLSCNFSVNYAL